MARRALPTLQAFPWKYAVSACGSLNTPTSGGRYGIYDQTGKHVLDDPEDEKITAATVTGAPGQYLVEWSIDAFDCASPREAAKKARAAQVRPGTIATIFDVTDTMTGEKTRIDLTEQGKLSSVKTTTQASSHPSVPGTQLARLGRRSCRRTAVKLATSIEARRAQIERFRRQTSHDYTQGYLDALDDVAIDMGLIPPSAGRPDRT